MKDDEQEQQAAGQGHRAGRQRRLAILMGHIADRPRPPVMDGQPDRQADVGRDNRQQHQPRAPQSHRHLAQERRVRIQRVLSLEDL